MSHIREQYFGMRWAYTAEGLFVGKIFASEIWGAYFQGGAYYRNLW